MVFFLQCHHLHFLQESIFLFKYHPWTKAEKRNVHQMCKDGLFFINVIFSKQLLLIQKHWNYIKYKYTCNGKKMFFIISVCILFLFSNWTLLCTTNYDGITFVTEEKRYLNIPLKKNQQLHLVLLRNCIFYDNLGSF